MHFEFANNQFFEYKNPDSEVLYESVWLYNDDLGTGFGILIEVANEIDFETVLDVCVMNLRKAFFHDVKSDSLSTMQAALQQLNEAFLELPESLGLNLEDLHLALVYVDPKKIYISKYNQAAVYIWRQRQLIAVSEMIDESSKAQTAVGFSEIVSGTYKYSDQIVLTSRRLTKFHDLSRWLDLLQKDMLLDEKIVLDFIKHNDLAIMKTKIQMKSYVPEVADKFVMPSLKSLNFKEPKFILGVLLVLIMVGGFAGYFSYNSVIQDKSLGQYQDMLDEVAGIVNNAKVEPDKKRVLFILSAAEDKLKEIVDAKVLLKQAKLQKQAIVEIKSKLDNVQKVDPTVVMNVFEVETFPKLKSVLKNGDDFLSVTDKAVYKSLPGLFPEKQFEFNKSLLNVTLNDRAASLLLYNGDKFQSFGLNSLVLRNLVAPDFDFDVDRILVYGSRVYILSREDNQLYKANLLSNGLSSFTKYLANLDEVLLQKIADFTIDGAVYLGLDDGSIAKLYKGKLDTTFRIKTQPLDKVEAIDSIYTSLDHSFLYVLESNKNRIVQYYKDPTGNLEYDRQYLFDLPDALEHMFVDYNQKVLYVASKKQVWQVPLKFID